MKTFNYYLLAASCVIFALPARGALITDGDFYAWSFGSTGTATVSREASSGNPGARLNITTISGATVYGTAIKTDFSTDLALADTLFELQLDVLSGSGAFGEGQRIQLLVEQDSSIYGTNLDITGYPLSWDTLSFSGTFSESSFSLWSGSGPATPDFGGGTTTLFGFAAGNTISGTLTQYYDNFSLEISPVPTPMEVEIDIKPGSDPNPINPGSNGLVPVAILSSEDFDATTVDPATVELAGASVAVRGKANKSMAHEEDVNGDGLIDLVVQVETESFDDLGAGGTVELTGTTFGGENIVGYDEVVIVPPDQ